MNGILNLSENSKNVIFLPKNMSMITIIIFAQTKFQGLQPHGFCYNMSTRWFALRFFL